jgi:hypothetical protein
VILWVVALALGISLAAVSYGRVRLPRAPFALRALAGTLAAALLLNAPIGPTRTLPPWVALDASASWTATEGGWAAATAAAEHALRLGGDSLVLFGSAVRGGPVPLTPTDTASRIGALVDQARALGRPVRIVTDGRLDDPERLAELPRGSAVVVPSLTLPSDLAIAAFAVPRAALIADTLDVRVLLRAGGAGAGERTLSVDLGGRLLATVAVGALGAFEERDVQVRAVVPASEGDQLLRASLDASDAVPANDSASATLRVSGVASVALISTAPDQDSRFALAVLRATQRGAVRGYVRVAPGQWREGDVLRPVSETVVRRALEQSSLAVLHGDTSYFGPPRARASGALVLVAPPEGSDDFYATSAGDSPLRAALAELPWDGLPPVRAGAAPRGGVGALMARRARRGEERPLVTLQEEPRRVAVVSAAGLWRWRTRGGRSADAFDAVWGSIFDWVVAGDAGATGDDDGPRLAREMVPRPASVASGPVGVAPVRDLAPRARGAWWLAALALLALCGEWIMRRRLGLR